MQTYLQKLAVSVVVGVFLFIATCARAGVPLAGANATASDTGASLFGLSGRPQADGTFQLRVDAGSPVGTLVVEVSTNLTAWWPVFTNSTAGSPLLYTDRDAGASPMRFYRVCWLAPADASATGQSVPPATAAKLFSPVVARAPAFTPTPPLSLPPIEPEFSVAGTILVTNRQTVTHQAFQVWVRGKQWLIRSSDVGWSGAGLEVGSDGEGVVCKLNGSPAGEPAMAILESNSVPTDVGGLAPCLYTFFCAAKYLGDRQSGYVTPVYDASAGVLFDPQLVRFAQWDRWDQRSWVYRRLDYFVKEPSAPVSQAGEFPDGALAEFRITSVTNWGGQLVPLTGEYCRLGGGRGANRIQAYGWFEVNLITKVSRQSLLPELPAGPGVGIVDRRLYNAGVSNRTLNYLYRGRAWPSLETAKAVHAAQHAR